MQISTIHRSAAAPPNEALVGRQHTGDENGSTRYATASLSAWGRTVELTSYRWTPGQRESSSYSKAGDYEVMGGRQHSGDENGQTRHQYARIVDQTSATVGAASIALAGPAGPPSPSPAREAARQHVVPKTGPGNRSAWMTASSAAPW
ncbi:hypothetical protein [Nonomuraea sp. NPDC005650]|uniref:hypothetical protein n=1 Tax=Nonomuraea sp. NPDC005650 TaxID=3157045 RepID=UPI0033B49995